MNAQMYKTWLFNNKKKKERKDMIKYGRKWTPRMVIYQPGRGAAEDRGRVRGKARRSRNVQALSGSCKESHG